VDGAGAAEAAVLAPSGRWISPLTWAKPVIERMGIGDVFSSFRYSFGRIVFKQISVGELQFVETPVRT
jgi:hypothetical protein